MKFVSWSLSPVLRVVSTVTIGLFAMGGRSLVAQDPSTLPRVDSVVVQGNVKNATPAVMAAMGISPGMTVTYRDLQRGVTTLMGSNLFDDVKILQSTVDGKLVVTIVVKERPVLVNYSFSGNTKYSDRSIDQLIRVLKARAIDREAVARSAWAIDSMYRHEGYFASGVTVKETVVDSGVEVHFDIVEGDRVVISRLDITGNTKFTDAQIATAMASGPERFWWFNSGKYDEQEVEYDVRERLPSWYASQGYIDFQVVSDSLIPTPGTGKAVLHLTVEEGPLYTVGSVEVLGNSKYSLTEVASFTPFGAPQMVGTGKAIGGTFNRTTWEVATNNLNQLYLNNGYINAYVRAEEMRRETPEGNHLIDLRWLIEEGMPAHIRMINIVGNNVTHESVIREAIVLIPGQLYNQDALLRSYQNIANLGYFEQPMPIPERVETKDGTGSVDINFRVSEKRTGTINFGASVGQGTGLGGFVGLEEPNLFGRGKRGKINWNFGKNVSDFSLTYSDPAIKGSRLSGNATLYNSRQKYIIGDLGRQRQEGASLQLGVPFMGSRYSRLFASYGLQRIRYDEGSAELQSRYPCTPCERSTIALSFLRETRIGLPFPIAGSLVSVSAEQNGGILGGTGNYRKIDVDTRWFAPLGKVGGKANAFGGGVQFTLGITLKSGFIFGDPGGFFTQLYSMGGVQYGIPTRGYDEFSITPSGFNPNNGGTQSSADAFGKAYAAATAEFGARLSQSMYISAFFDAGNVFRTARQYDPTRLYRGAGIGVAIISPLGPLGADFAYGFDKIDSSGRPKPGFQLHLKFGNIGN